MKLTIELVPRTIWGSNLRKRISRTEWNNIRKQSYKDSNYKCCICKKDCKEEEQLQCHELWDYNDKNHIQTLKGFIALCSNCHFIKHIGLATKFSIEGKLNMSKLEKHFCKVNKVDMSFFKDYLKKIDEQYELRSEHEWVTNLGKWNELISKN